MRTHKDYPMTANLQDSALFLWIPAFAEMTVRRS